MVGFPIYCLVLLVAPPVFGPNECASVAFMNFCANEVLESGWYEFVVDVDGKGRRGYIGRSS